MQWKDPLLRQFHVLLLLQACWAAAAIISGSSTEVQRHRPLARREAPELVDTSSGNTLQQLQGALAAQVLDEARANAQVLDEAPADRLLEQDEILTKTVSCPPMSESTGQPINCGVEADSLVFHQGCWDCYPDSYQVLYCNKNSLTSVFVDLCATSSNYRGAYCKDFYDSYHPECFFEGSEYKELFCESVKMVGRFTENCARDAEVGPNYCELFAIHGEGYGHCHHHPGFMMLFCERKQNSSEWDPACANHEEIGANYCEDFALPPQSDLRADCMNYPSYLILFCDIKASNNVTVQTCATNPTTAGMYCQQMALKQNGFQACFGVANFEGTYCAEIDWNNEACDSLRDSNR